MAEELKTVRYTTPPMEERRRRRSYYSHTICVCLLKYVKPYALWILSNLWTSMYKEKSDEKRWHHPHWSIYTHNNQYPPKYIAQQQASKQVSIDFKVFTEKEANREQHNDPTPKTVFPNTRFVVVANKTIQDVSFVDLMPPVLIACQVELSRRLGSLLLCVSVQCVTSINRVQLLPRVCLF